MAKKTHHFKGFSIITDAVEIKLDMNRLERNFNDAQYALDSAIMESMKPYMPLQEGSFIDVTQRMSQSLAGSGTVVAAAPPQGRYLYYGKTMVDEKTGSPWARKHAKKVLVNQFHKPINVKPNLTYSRGSAKPEWFDVAKEKDHDKWVKTVEKEVKKK